MQSQRIALRSEKALRILTPAASDHRFCSCEISVSAGTISLQGYARVRIFALAGVALAQAPDPAYEPLSRAYEALKAHDYDGAVEDFLKGIEVAPGRASIRKDLGYTYLKIGENELARDQFREAMRLEPSDPQVAMEYAFLCYETKEQAQARRIFDRIRQTGNEVAEQAFHSIDDPLAAGITRWKEAIANGADNFSAFRVGDPGRTEGRAGIGSRALRNGLAHFTGTTHGAGGFRAHLEVAEPG